MAKWLEQASQWHEMYCHDLGVMSSNPGRVVLAVHSTSEVTDGWVVKAGILSRRPNGEKSIQRPQIRQKSGGDPPIEPSSGTRPAAPKQT